MRARLRCAKYSRRLAILSQAFRITFLVNVRARKLAPACELTRGIDLQRVIKRSIYRRHVARYKFPLSRVLSNELVVMAKLRWKLRFVAEGRRLNSQILPRDFPRERRAEEKARNFSTESWRYLCMPFSFFSSQVRCERYQYYDKTKSPPRNISISGIKRSVYNTMFIIFFKETYVLKIYIKKHMYMKM